MPKVRDILARKGNAVHTVEPGATVLEATRKMNEKRLGALLVVEGHAIVGIFTERDVLTRVVAVGADPSTIHVGDVMTTSVAYCTPDTTIDECRGIFTAKRIRHLPVMEQEKLAGLITPGDVMAYESDDKERTIHYLTNYITS